jgi:apolipoprotein N-acyltransferase
LPEYLLLTDPTFFEEEDQVQMNKYKLLGLSVTGGVLSGLAWTGWCSGLILLLAFVPFFMIENYLYEHPKRFTSNACFIFVLPGFVIFSIITLGWMRIASIMGAICVIMGLSFLMAFTLWLAHAVRLRAGNLAGYISMISFWLTYEFLSLNVNIVSPWLNLGNGLSKDILFVQWYEVTGTAGGSLWILISNLLLTTIVVSYLKGKSIKLFPVIAWLLIIILPSAASICRYLTIEKNTSNGSEVLIIQPNIDPYTEKFTIPFDVQLRKVIGMANTGITSKTSWIITPETTVDDPASLDDLGNNKYVRQIKDLILQHPSVNVVTGLVTYKVYPNSVKPPTKSARKAGASDLFYDHFNSAVKIDSSDSFGIYHKSKLVPGIEMQFSNGPGRLLTKILPYLGGTKWGYGTQEERVCFAHSGSSMKVAPVICYESVFGKFVTEYVKKGAQAIFIITNDGWWKNTGGYRQHLDFASLRAIETRRQVARAANTGVSCIIDIRGRRVKETSWWSKAILSGKIYPESKITPYVKYGDYLLVISACLSGVIIIIVFIAIPLIKK